MLDNLHKYGEDIIWSLPCLFELEPAYSAIYEYAKLCGVNLPTCHLFGSPASAWTGGRTPFVTNQLDKMVVQKLFQYVRNMNAIPTITFSYTGLEKDDLSDPYANMLLDVGIEYNSRYIVYSDLLRDYIKQKDPNAEIVASVIKPTLYFQSTSKVEEPTFENETNYYNKLLDEYDVVVIRPEYSRNPLFYENPSVLKDPSRVEVLINQTCIPNCPIATQHYKEIDNTRNKYEVGTIGCIREGSDPIESIKKSLIHTSDELKKMTQKGVKRLKIKGRSEQMYSMTSIIFLLAGQMFNQDGDNYFLMNQFAIQSHVDKEIQIFQKSVFGY